MRDGRFRRDNREGTCSSEEFRKIRSIEHGFDVFLIRLFVHRAMQEFSSIDVGRSLCSFRS